MATLISALLLTLSYCSRLRNKPNPSNAMLFGASDVGKTCMAKRLATGIFDMSTVATIGADNYKLCLSVDKTPVELTLWDTAGQERFATMGNFYYRMAEIAIVVYSVASPGSWERAKLCLETLLDGNTKAVSIIVLGSHADLDEFTVGDEDGEPQYLSEIAYNHCKMLNIPHMLVSSLDGTNMDLLLKWLGQTTLRRLHDSMAAQQKLANAASASSVKIQLETDEGYMQLNDSCC